MLLLLLHIGIYHGSEIFHCSDERLNRIWHTGAYTVLLNMQDYLYDGPKRDRIIWMGDMHPEIRCILAGIPGYVYSPFFIGFSDKTLSAAVVHESCIHLFSMVHYIAG